MNEDTKVNLPTISDAKLAFINLIIKLGFDSAVIVWNNINKAANVDDAIAALQASRGKTWNDYAQKEQ